MKITPAERMPLFSTGGWSQTSSCSTLLSALASQRGEATSAKLLMLRRSLLQRLAKSTWIKRLQSTSTTRLVLDPTTKLLFCKMARMPQPQACKDSCSRMEIHTLLRLTQKKLFKRPTIHNCKPNWLNSSNLRLKLERTR